MEKKNTSNNTMKLTEKKKWQLNHQGQRVKETSRRIICLLDNKEIVI